MDITECVRNRIVIPYDFCMTFRSGYGINFTPYVKGIKYKMTCSINDDSRSS